MKFFPPLPEDLLPWRSTRGQKWKKRVFVKICSWIFFFFQFTSPLHNPINATHIRDSWSWLEECDLRIAFWAVYRKLWLITVWIHHRSRVWAFCRVPRNFNRHLLPQKKGKRHSVTNAQLIRPTFLFLKVHVHSHSLIIIIFTNNTNFFLFLSYTVLIIFHISSFITFDIHHLWWTQELPPPFFSFWIELRKKVFPMIHMLDQKVTNEQGLLQILMDDDGYSTSKFNFSLSFFLVVRCSLLVVRCLAVRCSLHGVSRCSVSRSGYSEARIK